MSPQRALARLKVDDSPLTTAMVAGLLVFAPLIKGGNIPFPLLILELLSLLLLARLVFLPAFRSQLPGWGMAAILAAVLLPLLYLVPVPYGIWGSLPGRAPYLEIIDLARDGAAPLMGRAISLRPFDSEVGWYALLYPLAIFLVTVGLPDNRIGLLLKIFLGVAVAQALLGFLQFVQGPDSIFRFGNPYYPESGVGTYVNRNHLAGLLYLALPISIALLIKPFVGRAGGAAKALGSAVVVLRTLLVGMMPVILLIGLFFTRSRAGIVLGLVGLLLTALLLSLRLGKRKLLALVAAVISIGVFAALMTGIGPIVDRYASPSTIDNERWNIFSASLQAAAEFVPIGAGPATFPETFPRFQPGDMSGFINRVHNDFLEVYFDGGWVLLIPVLLLVLMYFARWKRLWGDGEWDQLRVLQGAAGVSVLLMLLHSLMDFNLHIPANAGYFAFCAGVFLHRSSQSARSVGRTAVASESRKNAIQKVPREIPSENLANPFATGPSAEVHQDQEAVRE